MSSNEEKSKNEHSKPLNKANSQIKILEESLIRQDRKIDDLKKEIEKLKIENEQLKKELSKSRVLPKWVKPNKTDEQIKKAKKKGPKVGHAPHVRKRPENIDKTVIVVPENCPQGGGELPFPSASKWHSHVQIDLPEVGKLVITEFKVGSSYCSYCKKYHQAGGRVQGSLYGPRLHAQVCYWKYSLGLTLLKIQKLLMNQYELNISTGQLSEILSRSANKFEDAYAELKTKLREQDHLHVDETGWRVEGKNAWLWSFSNEDISVYTIGDSRGQDVVEEVLGEVFGGVLCSDFYGSYQKIKSLKQKCWVHVLRDLRVLAEKEPEDIEVQYFLSKMKGFFNRGKQLREDKANGKNIETRLKRIKNETENFAKREFKKVELRTLGKRLIKYRLEMYTFIEKNIEPTNNNAEREIRPAVLMRKTSYGNRSDRGRNNQAILMSMIRTADKIGQNFVNMATEHFSR